ncbi:MAG TPA: farnesyl diphosphate synthase [Casimicrobiaceae bacterium]|jgi:farnesyl diphosphate synthase|nr:farnesyl diphosphate synthase [Casimicrobiaceae bacterium]
MNPDLAWEVWSRERSRRIESVLDRTLAGADGSPRRLQDAMRYAALGGGKRVRALLAYAGGELAGADPDDVDGAAAAVELIHAYSLVHDDLPCMDDDVLRRGKPSCHVAFGEAIALLAGDALQSLAFEVLARTPAREPAAQIALLAQASGVSGMAGGQAIDLTTVGEMLALSELERMHALKTGALIRAAVRLGAGCGRPMSVDENDALDRYASAIGLGFQIVDDVLDVEGTALSLGKTAGKDAMQRKTTYASLLGSSAARERIEALRADARAALGGFATARRLIELGDWVASRNR